MDYVTTESQRDSVVSNYEARLDALHKRAVSIREILCLTGATIYCPNQPEPEILSFGEELQNKAAVTGVRLGSNDVPEEALEPRFEVITLTYYNPTEAQTDGAPCIAANMDDICSMAAQGGRKIMALSRDLVNKQGTVWFDYGDYAYLSHENPACSGVYVVLDTMNKIYNRYGDIFSMVGNPGFHKCKGVTLRKLR